MSVISIPAVNQNAVVVLPAVLGMFHVITQIAYSYSAVPIGGRLTVVDDVTTRFDQDIALSGRDVFDISIASVAPNTAMTVTLFAGGLTVQGKLVVQSYDY